MTIVVLSDAEQDAWRQKGTDKATQLIRELGEKGLTGHNHFDALDSMIAAADYSILHCTEHFNAHGEYIPKDAQHVSDLCQQDLERLAGTAIKAQVVGALLTQELKKNDLSHINGTSLIFQKWASRFGLDEMEEFSPPPQSGIVIRSELAYK